MSTAAEPAARIEERASQPKDEGSKAPAKPKGGGRKVVRTVILLAVLGGGAAAGGWYWWSHRGLESTDDAQIDADLVAVPARVGGVVSKVLVEENQIVKAGDPLVQIDDAQIVARVAQAQAELEAAQAAFDSADADAKVVEATAGGSKSAAEASVLGASAGLATSAQEIQEQQAAVSAATASRDQAKLEYDRLAPLVQNGAATQADLDRAKSSLDSAEARLRQAKAALAAAQAGSASAAAKIGEAKAHLAQTSATDAEIKEAKAKADAAKARVGTAQAMLDLAKLDLQYAKIVAPSDGIASKKAVVVGQMVQPGQAVVMIVPNQTWVTANFKETQLEKMHVGQDVDIEVDAFPGRHLHGKVASFSGATGAKFSLLPPDNATGNFTKVVQRVPVRILLDNVPTDVAIRPGMSVDATVDTRK